MWWVMLIMWQATKYNKTHGNPLFFLHKQRASLDQLFFFLMYTPFYFCTKLVSRGVLFSFFPHSFTQVGDACAPPKPQRYKSTPGKLDLGHHQYKSHSQVKKTKSSSAEQLCQRRG